MRVLSAGCWVLRGSSLVAVFLAVLPPCRLAAQSDPRLVAAVHLAQEGQGDSARVQVKRILDATPAASPLYAEALYTAGVVAATTAERERQFQRLVVEFNGSAWSDDALLQLIQMNFARGDLPAVVRTAERLASDYPQSEVIPNAALWAARAYFREDKVADGCRWLANGLVRADTLDVELRNGLTFLNGRCATPTDTAAGRSGGQAARPAEPATASTPPAPATQVPTARPPDRLTVWSVQVASSSNQNNADALVNRLTDEGFAGGYVVRDGSAYKVRVGKLAQRADADTLLARIRVKHPQAFVVEDRP